MKRVIKMDCQGYVNVNAIRNDLGGMPYSTVELTDHRGILYLPCELPLGSKFNVTIRIKPLFKPTKKEIADAKGVSI